MFKIYHFLRRRRATFDCLRIMNSNSGVNATFGGLRVRQRPVGGEGEMPRLHYYTCTFRLSPYVFHHKSKTRRNKHAYTYRMVMLTCDDFIVGTYNFIPAFDYCHGRVLKFIRTRSNAVFGFKLFSTFQSGSRVSGLLCACVSIADGERGHRDRERLAKIVDRPATYGQTSGQSEKTLRFANEENVSPTSSSLELIRCFRHRRPNYT